MKTSPKGIALIKSAEGLRLKAYPDTVTGGLAWTIWYGSTSGFTNSMVITDAQGEQTLEGDLVMLLPTALAGCGSRLPAPAISAVCGDLPSSSFEGGLVLCSGCW